MAWLTRYWKFSKLKLNGLLAQLGAQEFSRSDWALLGVLVFLLGMATMLVASESGIRAGVIKALESKEGSYKSAASSSPAGVAPGASIVRGGEETGIYNLPPVTTALGDNSGNAELELSLEYRKGKVRQIVRRVTLSPEEEESFFSKKKGALLDSVVSSFAGLSQKSFTTDEGMEQVKDSLVTSMNNIFTEDEVIREVYFRKLTFFPFQF